MATGKTAGGCPGSIGEVVHLLAGASHIPVTHLVGFADEGREQRLVAKIVDDARDSATAPMQRAKRPAREARPAVATGERETVMNIVRHVGARKRMQLVVDENALAELTKLVAFQDLLQLRLSHQDNL